MPEPITRPEFNEAIGRIHDKIDSIAKTGIQIEVSANLMRVAVDKICDCIYGTNGKEGMTVKIAKMFERIGLQSKLIFFMLTSIVGISFYILQSFLSKR